MKNKELGYELSDFVGATERMTLVYRKNLAFGDTLIVQTLNSTYIIQVWNNDTFGVTGGWFTHQGLSMSKMKIVGCTNGGSAVKQDIIAGCGLCIEFGNGLCTSNIADISIIRSSNLN